MNYLLHVALLISGCFLYYRFVLRSETNFQINRWLLLCCLIGAFLLPLLKVPEAWSARPLPVALPDLSVVAASTSELPMPVAELPPPVKPVEPMLPGTALPADQPPIWQQMDWWTLLFWLYWTGVGLFSVHFVIQLGIILFRVVRFPNYALGGFRIVELNHPVAPHSFWNRIFLYPAQYDSDTFHRIVQHERIHLRQRHTFDILLAELLLIVQWFNPFAWWLRSAIEHNLEFLTDAEMLRSGTDRVAYQLSLVKVAAPNHPDGLASNYNQSFLEKRINMMNAKRSSARTAWKYLALLPLIFFSVLQLNAVQTAQSEPSQVNPEPTPIVAPNPTPYPSEEVRVELAPKQMEAPVAIPTFIDPALLSAESRTWSATIEGNQVCFHLQIKDDNNNHYMTTDHCFERSELSELPRNAIGTFFVEREAGKLEFRGIFDGEEGAGTFTFKPNQDFISSLNAEGYRDIDPNEVLFLFLTDINADYIQYVKSEGYNPSTRQLVELAIFDFNRVQLEKTLDELQGLGYDKPGLKRLIALRIHKVDGDYIQELQRAGFEDLSLEEAVQAKIHGLNPERLADFRASGFDQLTFQNALQLSIHGVSADYVKMLNSYGFANLSAQKAVQARIHGVDKERLEDLGREGLPTNSLEQVIQLGIHNVDGAFIQGLRDAGYTDLGVEEYIQASIFNINPSFIEQYQDLGLGDIEFEELKALHIHHVTPEFIRQNRERGESVQDFIKLKIHGGWNKN